MSDVVIATRRLSRHFGGVAALQHLDLEVRRGEVFGVLGAVGPVDGLVAADLEVREVVELTSSLEAVYLALHELGQDQ